MQRKSFETMSCPIARGLERVGEGWTLLIMRDVLHGLTRFDQLQTHLDIPPNTLARRLNALVDAGLLERHRYSEHPPRDEYLPTPSGRDLWPVLIALLAWGNRHCAPEGRSVILVDRRTGVEVDPVLADPATGQPIDGSYGLAPGPAAGPRTRVRFAAAGRAR
jgi:DNA-binding HxlR family transcriptional regulator